MFGPAAAPQRYGTRRRLQLPRGVNDVRPRHPAAPPTGTRPRTGTRFFVAGPGVMSRTPPVEPVGDVQKAIHVPLALPDLSVRARRPARTDKSGSIVAR